MFTEYCQTTPITLLEPGKPGIEDEDSANANTTDPTRQSIVTICPVG